MNFPNFPLYVSLKTEEFKELNESQKDELFELVKDMNDPKHEQIYALIRAYHLDHDNHIQDIPYGGKQLKTGLKLDIDCLPSKLQYILYQFSKIN
uniref:NET domain-containing protein n=1 Tax=viral metagenome TaxID=1070528 RepID=A0A6C0KH47_9ZZZZ